MESMDKRLALICVTLIAVVVFAGTGYAEIDLEACFGAWLFDEGEGDVAEDSSGKGNDGEIKGAEWVEGKIGKALEFDGATSRVDIPDSDSLNDVEEITILAWVYLEREVTSGTWNSVAGKNPYSNGYLMWIEVPQEPCGLVYVGGRFDDRAGAQIDLDEWHHLAFTRDFDGEMKFYIDGALVQTAQSSAGPITTIPGPLSIGGQSPQVLDGFIDEVIFFNIVLTEDDISNIMTKGLEGATAVSSVDKLAATWGQIKSIE
jgi:hypothetical protein